MCLIAVNYHYIRKDFAETYPAISGITPYEFEKQLKILGGYGKFLGENDVLEYVSRKSIPVDRGIVITFDDGLAEQYELALPVLKRLRIPAIFFINTRPVLDRKVELVHKIHLARVNINQDVISRELDDFLVAEGIRIDEDALEKGQNHYMYDSTSIKRLKYILNFILHYEQQDVFVDRLLHKYLDFDEAAVSGKLYMSIDQIRNLSRMGMIGTHSHRHIQLGLLPIEEAEKDIQTSLDILSELRGSPINCLSYPYGGRQSCSIEVAKIAGSAGIKFAFTMERSKNKDLKNPMFLSRFASNDLPGYREMGDIQSIDMAKLPEASWYRNRSMR